MRCFFKVFVALCLALTVSACSKPAAWASDEDLAKVQYRDAGPTKLTLFTMINNRSGTGAHTSLMISASQRVIWDPAGSFYHPSIPERNDVLFGIKKGTKGKGYFTDAKFHPSFISLMYGNNAKCCFGKFKHPCLIQSHEMVRTICARRPAVMSV